MLLHCTKGFKIFHINSFWLIYDTICRHKSESTIAQAMGCCLAVVPSYYLNQLWLSISEVLWHSPEGNFIGNAQYLYPWYEFKTITLILQPHFPEANDRNIPRSSSHITFVFIDFYETMYAQDISHCITYDALSLWFIYYHRYIFL